jgi:hypothetical protein
MVAIKYLTVSGAWVVVVVEIGAFVVGLAVAASVTVVGASVVARTSCDSSAGRADIPTISEIAINKSFHFMVAGDVLERRKEGKNDNFRLFNFSTN